MVRYCKNCVGIIGVERNKSAYCSDTCKKAYSGSCVSKNNQRTYINFNGEQSTGKKISEGRKLSKKIATCSTQDLLEEFGGIE